MEGVDSPLNNVSDEIAWVTFLWLHQTDLKSRALGSDYGSSYPSIPFLNLCNLYTSHMNLSPGLRVSLGSFFLTQGLSWQPNWISLSLAGLHPLWIIYTARKYRLVALFNVCSNYSHPSSMCLATAVTSHAILNSFHAGTAGGSCS